MVIQTAILSFVLFCHYFCCYGNEIDKRFSNFYKSYSQSTHSYYRHRMPSYLPDSEIIHRLFPRPLKNPEKVKASMAQQIEIRQLVSKSLVLDYLNMKEIPVGKYLAYRPVPADNRAAFQDAIRLVENCGLFPDEDEEDSEAPWHVSLHCGNAGHQCSGALIGKRLILTSADCLVQP